MYERPQRLAPKLKAIRQRLGVSQTGMKQLLMFAGNYGRISEFERGRRQPNIVTILRYARLAGLPMDDLVDDEIELKF
jgi:transcriptional regulator with XRE-family HTH domain